MTRPLIILSRKILLEDCDDLLFSIFGNEPTFTIMLFPTSSNWMVCKNKENGLQGKILCPSSFLLEWFAKTKKRDFLQRQVSLSRPDCCRWLQVQLGFRTNHGREQKKQQQPIFSKKRSQRPQEAEEGKGKPTKKTKTRNIRTMEGKGKKGPAWYRGYFLFRLSKRIVGYVGTDDPLWYLAN